MAKLYFRYGAMGCGKTMQLLQVAFNYEERGMKVCVIKPATDTKDGTKLQTRIGPERETDFCFTKKEDLYQKIARDYANVACVLVDEAQFLTPVQAEQLLYITVKLNIPVMAWGLRLNFRIEDGGFEGATRLLQLADDIEEIKTICECGRKATLNCRFLDNKLVTDGPDILIDDGTHNIEYRALCPKCYYKYLNAKPKNGTYIVIEGQDGTGKSTQAELLKDYFEKQGRKVVIMEEPDGDIPQAHAIHDILLTKGYKLEPMTNVLLFTSARSELWRKIAEPVLDNGGVVISARNWWSTLAYQGYGEGIPQGQIVKLTEETLPDRYAHPDHGCILTVPDHVRYKRQKHRGKAKETFESKPNDFQQRVNDGYVRVAEDFHLPLVDASGTPEEVFIKICETLKF